MNQLPPIDSRVILIRATLFQTAGTPAIVLEHVNEITVKLKCHPDRSISNYDDSINISDIELVSCEEPRRWDKIIGMGTQDGIDITGLTGKILCDHEDYGYAIQFNLHNSSFHDCSEGEPSGREGYCWWVDRDNLVFLVTKSPKLDGLKCQSINKKLNQETS